MKGTLKLRKPKKDNPQGLYVHYYDLVGYDYSFFKTTDKKGRVQLDVQSGNIFVTLPVLPDDALMVWVLDNRKIFDGEITFHDAHEESLDKLYFEEARCVDFRLHYEPNKDDATQNVQLLLTINAQRMIVGDSEYINSGQWATNN